MQWHSKSEAEAQEESGTDGFKDWARSSHPGQVETQGTGTPLVSLSMTSFLKTIGTALV